MESTCLDGHKATASRVPVLHVPSLSTNGPLPGSSPSALRFKPGDSLPQEPATRQALFAARQKVPASNAPPAQRFGSGRRRDQAPALATARPMPTPCPVVP